MPLKLWLPLDGTNENRGISGATTVGSPASWGDGRTGKCAVFNNSASNYIVSTSKAFDYIVEDFSWAIWAKKDYSSITSTSMWIFTVGRADNGGRGYGLRAGPTYLQVYFGTSTWTIDCPDNEWHHFAFTRNGTAIKIYRDGTLITSTTFSGTLPTYSDGNGPGVGCFHYSGNIYPLIGAVSDFRIYNHTLSIKEVYELSRAMIMHYPLWAPGNANPNLLTWIKNYTRTNPLVHTSKAADGAKYLGNDSLVTVTPGKAYYIQVKSTAIPGTHGGSAAITNNFTIFLYQRNQGTSKVIGGYDVAPNLNKNNIFINAPDQQLYVWKWTAPSNAQDITLRTNSYSDGTTTVTLKFWDFKIEEGTYTAYVPPKNSAQYTELGYGIGIVRDATGRRNDAQLYTNAPTFGSGSPRYATCASFASGSCIWPIPDPIKSTTTEFTISVWFRTTTVSGNQCIWNGRTTTGAAVAIFIVNSSLRIDDSNQTAVSPSLTANTWYHLAVTWKSGGNKIIYLNGEQKTSVAAGTLSKSNANASIGRSSSGDSLATSNYFSGQMSDFRVYGTALTADDVKHLYDVSASIDNNGDMFASSFEEIENAPSIAKNGLVYGSRFTESGGTQRLFSAFNGTPVYPNSPPRTFTPTTAQNSTVAWYFFECIPGIQTYHITMRVDWSGFEDITTTNPTFDAWFQGPARRTDGSGNEWTASSFTTALNNHKRLGTLAKGAASGTYLYDMDFTLSSYYPGEYIGQYLGMRSDYSNGIGKFSISDIRIYPVEEHKTNAASLCANGAIQVRLLDESA